MVTKVGEVGCRSFRPRVGQLGGLVLTSSKFGVASPRRVAAKRIVAAWVKLADQRAVRLAATLCRRMVVACVALVPAQLSAKVSAASVVTM